jgi:hypothetical protein
VNEVVGLLAARAPKLKKAVRDAEKAGYAYVIVDGTLIPIDRVAKDRPFYSGKHKKHGMNLQVIASPDGDLLRVSGALPGSVHDKKAEWIWGVIAELENASLVTLADKGYQGSSHAKVPYKGKGKPESQKQANKAHAKLRGPGERANAQLKTWKILCKLRSARGERVNSPRPSTYCSPARHNRDEIGSVLELELIIDGSIPRYNFNHIAMLRDGGDVVGHASVCGHVCYYQARSRIFQSPVT